MIKPNKITKLNANAVEAKSISDQTENNSNKHIANVVGAGPVSARNHRGITLVALIITIIVMLILVGVSITMAIKGGLFDTTKKAAKQAEDAKRKEQELASGRIKIDGVWYDSLEDYAIGKESATQGVEDLNESNTKFKYTPEGWTNGEVKVGIDASSVVAGFILKYSTDGINWNNYTAEIPMGANGEIYAKLVDTDGNEGGAITGNVSNIDKDAPKINTHIAKNGEETDVSIPLSINVTDGVSGISKIEWYYKKSTDPESKYEENKKTDEYKEVNGKEAGEKGAVTKERALTGLSPLTTYNIYAVVYDVAGNSTRSPAGTSTMDITTKEPAVKPEIGDYILYEPDTVSTPYSLAGTGSGYGNYNTSVTPYTLTTPTNQSIPQETLQWQVLKVHNDGSIDIIGTPTSNIVYFQGALGYNNGVYLLNDICEKLYSKKNSAGTIIAKARSVNIEDFEDEENGGSWKSARDSYTNGILQYGHTKTYTDARYRYYPNIYAEENGSGINTTTVKTNGIKETNPYYTSPTREEASQAGSNGLTVTQTYYSIPINETNYGATAKVLYNSKYYWLASRVVMVNSRRASFRLRYANTSLFTSGMFGSDGNADNDACAFRPVVSLGSSVSYSVKTLKTDGSPSTYNVAF